MHPLEQECRHHDSQGTFIVPPCADNELRKVSRSSLSGVNTVSAVFGKDGRFIYIGQSKGFLSILDTNSLQFLDVLKVTILHASPLSSCFPRVCHT